MHLFVMNIGHMLRVNIKFQKVVICMSDEISKINTNDEDLNEPKTRGKKATNTRVVRHKTE